MAVHRKKDILFNRHSDDLIENSASEMANNLQIDKKMAMSAYLTAASSSLQGVADVCWPDGRVSPISLYTLLLAGSGERKTTAFAEANSVILNKNEKLSVRNEGRSMEYDSKLRIWSKKYKAVENKIVREAVKGKDTEQHENMLKELRKDKPEKPLLIDFIYKDTTSEALMQGIADKSKYVSLISSEGSGILNGRAFKNFPSINDIWSGDELKVDRKSSSSSYVTGARLTIGIMVQNEIMNEFNKKNSNELRASGLWARFLVFIPESRIGKRSHAEPKRNANTLLFNHKCGEYIEQQVKVIENMEKRAKMKLSTEAASDFRNMCQNFESDTLPGRRFYYFKDLASKIPENIIRLSALLSAFDKGLDVRVSRKYIQKASEIVQQCAEDFMCLFYVPSEEDRDDNALLDWLEKKRVVGYRYLKKNYIRRNVTYRLRNVEKLNASIDRLSSQGRIGRLWFGNVETIDMSPCLMVDQIAANHELFGDSGPFYAKY